MKPRITTVLVTVTFLTMACAGLAAQSVTAVPVGENQVVYEFVGQFNNTPTTSQQFGYLSKIRGLEPIFSGEPENETTAEFTFVTNATTDRVIVNGPLKIVNRSGTTTIYRNTAPADFTHPETFSQGTPIQTSTYSQQVVLNTLTNSFVTVHTNVISRTQPFSLNGNTYRLGSRGAAFRTSYFGQSNTDTVPSGWFGGSAVGIHD